MVLQGSSAASRRCSAPEWRDPEKTLLSLKNLEVRGRREVAPRQIRSAAGAQPTRPAPLASWFPASCHHAVPDVSCELRLFLCCRANHSATPLSESPLPSGLLQALDHVQLVQSIIARKPM